jgi:uncharacterized protein YecT (DUF1311 family)
MPGRQEVEMRRLILVVALLPRLASAQSLSAGPVVINVPRSAQYDACFDEADGNDLDMAACNDEEMTHWGHRLNAAYAALRQQLDPADFADLQKAQRA